MDKNQKILLALTEHRDDAAMRKAHAETKAKKARNPEKKEAFAAEAKLWAKREARWADEVAFRQSMNF